LAAAKSRPSSSSTLVASVSLSAACVGTGLLAAQANILSSFLFFCHKHSYVLSPTCVIFSIEEWVHHLAMTVFRMRCSQLKNRMRMGMRDFKLDEREFCSCLMSQL
jgi:hypothetical protein